MAVMTGAVEVRQGLGLSELAPRVLQSEIRAMTVLAEAAGGVNLAQGVCDTEVPAVVAEAAQAAVRDGHNIYTRLDGIARLRRAIAAKAERTFAASVGAVPEMQDGDGVGAEQAAGTERRFAVDPDREVLVTSGATGAMHAAAMALLNPGDEVILFEPFYGYHMGTLRSMRVKTVPVLLDAASGWGLDVAAVRAAVTERTRAIVINTPSNPAGKVFTRAELEALAEIAREHDLFVFTDEIYEHFLYGEARHVSPFVLDGMRERTIVISGFSKTFSVTGWRVGYVIADARWLGSIGYFHDLTYVCAPSPFQHGCAAGLEQLPQMFYAKLAADHEEKRAVLVDALEAADMEPHVPDGAYYILADASGLPGATAAERARWLLQETGVAAVAGSAFFAQTAGSPGSGKGEDLLRFCFAKKDDELEEACRRLRRLTR